MKSTRMETTKIIVDGKACMIAHSFREDRAVVNYDGLFVLVDLGQDGTWSMSGEPARDEEKAVMKTLTDPTEGKVVVTVTKDV
jgi:hypothetical protein